MKKTAITLFLLFLLSIAVVRAAADMSVPSEVQILFEEETDDASFTITNTGTEVLTQIIIVSRTDYNLKFSLDRSSYFDSITIPTLGINESASINAKATLPLGEFTTSPIGTATITSGQNVSKSIVFRGTVTSKIEFDKVQFKGGKKNRDVQNGDIISDVKPGEKIEMELDLKNTFTEAENVDILDINVEVTIIDINDNSDLEENAEINRIDADEKENVVLDFTIPEESDSGKFDLVLRVYGKDENGIRHEVTRNFQIEVEKDSHDVRVYQTSLSKTVVSCDRRTTLRTTIKNFGKKEEDEAALRISSPELGIDFKKYEIDLDNDAFDERSEFQYSTTIDIPKSQANGEYTITISAFRNDDKKEDEKTISLTVADCYEPAPSPAIVQPVVPTQIPQVIVLPSDQDSFQDENLPVFWISFVIIVIGLFIFIIMLIMAGQRKKRSYWRRR